MYIYIYREREREREKSHNHIYANHINFRHIHFSSYGNLKVIFETTFRELSFSSFILTSYNIYIQSLFAVKFYNSRLKLISYYE